MAKASASAAGPSSSRGQSCSRRCVDRAASAGTAAVYAAVCSGGAAYPLPRPACTGHCTRTGLSTAHFSLSWFRMCSCTHHIQLQRSIAVQQQASWQTAHDLHYFVQRHALVYVMALDPSCSLQSYRHNSTCCHFYTYRIHGTEPCTSTDKVKGGDGTAAPTNENNTHMFRFGIKHQHSNL